MSCRLLRRIPIAVVGGMLLVVLGCTTRQIDGQRGNHEEEISEATSSTASETVSTTHQSEPPENAAAKSAHTNSTHGHDASTVAPALSATEFKRELSSIRDEISAIRDELSSIRKMNAAHESDGSEKMLQPVWPSQATSAQELNRLADLSDAFREVAHEAKPCVVQVAAELRLGQGNRRVSVDRSQRETEELVQRFGPFFELDPELQQFFRNRGSQSPAPDYDKYNVPLPVGSGSGWIYDTQGHVITNYHVIAEADRIKLTFYDDSSAEATLVGSDPHTDIAVLKTAKPDLTKATIAAQPAVQGDIVLAIGSPFRYAFSVSQGIVSATGRKMGILGPQGYENFIQTDAAINPGNSGGPLTNARGEVVGMNSVIASQSGAFEGIGFAIPVDMIRNVVDEIIRKGKVERGYLGAVISDEKRLLATFGVDRGVLIEDVVDSGPADKAGLQSGDVVVRLGDERLDNASRLRQQVAQTDPGQTFVLDTIRNGQHRSVEIVLEQAPTGKTAEGTTVQPRTPRPRGTPDEVDVLAKLGFEKLQEVDSQLTQRYDFGVDHGLVVLDVRQYSAVHIAGLRRGQIITQVQGKKIGTVAELRDAIEQANLHDGVRVRIHTVGGPSRFALLSLNE